MRRRELPTHTLEGLGLWLTLSRGVGSSDCDPPCPEGVRTREISDLGYFYIGTFFHYVRDYATYPCTIALHSS